MGEAAQGQSCLRAGSRRVPSALARAGDRAARQVQALTV